MIGIVKRTAKFTCAVTAARQEAYLLDKDWGALSMLTCVSCGYNKQYKKTFESTQCPDEQELVRHIHRRSITLRKSASSGENFEETSLRRVSCNMVFSSSQLAIYSFSCFFVNLGHSSGQIGSSLVVSFWERGPQDVETCPSDPGLRQHIFTLIPMTVQRLLGGVANARARPPHHVDVV